MSRYYGSSSSSSESDTSLFDKLNSGIKRRKKFPKPTLKRNKREGMCMCSGDEKSSQELNIIRIESDMDFEDIPKEILKTKQKNLIEFENDEILEESLLSLPREEVEIDVNKIFSRKYQIALYYIFFNLFVLVLL